jgi:segregation and condensation protein A
MSDYRVNLEVFSGPLDLLLYLVRKEEVDIYDISIAKITEEYIRYIEILKMLNMELAGDFLIMAATLMEIKSAMLLPADELEDIDQGEAIDPRKELIRQLLEYKKFKDAANMLKNSADTQKQRYQRSDTILPKLSEEKEPHVDMEQLSIWDLLSAFDTVMQSIGTVMDISHISDDTPIDLYQIEILHRLQSDGAMSFERIFEDKKNKLVMIGLFLAILELVREKLITAEQSDVAGAIYLRALTDEPAEEAVHKAILTTVNGESSEIDDPQQPRIHIEELAAQEQLRQNQDKASVPDSKTND